MKHRETHPNLDVPGCFGCRVSSVAIAPSALGSPQAREVNERERRWARDMPAYKRLRNDGLEVRGIDGAADLEAKATHPMEVAIGKTFDGVKHKDARIDEANAFLKGT